MIAAPFLALGWAILGYGFFNMGGAWPILMLPTMLMLVWTIIHIGGYAAFQDDRDQLDSVLDMFSYPKKWKRIDRGVTIPGMVEVYETYTNEIRVKVKVEGKIVTYEANWAYAARFRNKMKLLQDWRELEALVGHFSEIRQ